MKPAFAIGMVFGGCCANNIFLELLVKEVPSAGNIITFAQFLFIAAHGFIFTSNFGQKKNAIPLRIYIGMVLFFFVTSVINNYALNFNIPMPLHMIFRAGSLMASLVLGVIILKKRYELYKYISVVMITLGIIVSTLASAQFVEKEKDADQDPLNSKNSEESSNEFITWTIGIFLLTLALFLSARMGIYQETVYKKHGKHPSEALFYNHALPLPLFLFLYKDIFKHIVLFNDSPLVGVPLLDFGFPRLWLYLLGNVITQYICIRGVFVLTTECSSLTVTLVVTLRKFISLTISIWYFSNPFTAQHGLGAVLVFGGTLIFTDVFTNVKKKLL